MGIVCSVTYDEDQLDDTLYEDLDESTQGPFDVVWISPRVG